MRERVYKIVCAALAAALLFWVPAGCGGRTGGQDKIKIVATVFPEYDWIRQIVGEESGTTDITMLLDKGVDMHSYQPSAEDIVKISTCDMFIYVGGESDKWVEDVLGQAKNSGMTVVRLLDVLGDKAKEEQLAEGMEADENEEDAGEEEGPEYDEHVWLSLKNAAVFCRYLSERLCELDPENSSAYKDNSEKYIDRLGELDRRYQDTVDNAPVKTLLFGDRFPFRYMTEDYGLDYYAAFPGCSAETEASFKTIVFLSGKVDELGLHSIIKLENSDGSVAQTIKENTASKDQEILTLDSMQSVTKEDIMEGVSYLSVMEGNLAVLEKALR